MSLEITAQAGKTKIPIYEYGEGGLYNPNGVEIVYGFEDGQKKYAYGGIGEGSAEEIAYGGIENSGGLHSIKLNRSLKKGEEVRFHWFNGYDLIIFEKDGETKVKKIVGGTYQEIGKWADENGNSEFTCPKFDDDIYTKRFDYIETKNFKEF